MKKILFILLFLLVSCTNKDFNNVDLVKDYVKNDKIILSLGDSLTAGYNLALEESYPFQLKGLLDSKGYNYEVINAGVSADTSKQLLDRVDLYLDDDVNMPEIAILVIGGNDGLRGKSIDDLEDNIISIINKLQSKNVKVVLGGMKVPPNLGIVYSHDFHGIYKKISNEYDVLLIDFFLDGVAGNSDLNLADGIHPNEEGYKMISENIFDFLIDNKLLNND